MSDGSRCCPQSGGGPDQRECAARPGTAIEPTLFASSRENLAARAARQFRASMALAPNDPAIFNSMMGLGMAYFIKGSPNRALEWMEKGLALHPRAVWINRNLAPAYIAAERQVDAERCVRALLDEYSGLSVAAVSDAMVMSRPTMARVIAGLSRAGLPRS
jgi:predicted Zn-dependent protease